MIASLERAKSPLVSLALACLLAPALPAQDASAVGVPLDNLKGRWLNYATGPIRPLVYSADGRWIFNLNQPGSRLAIYESIGLTRMAEVPLGQGLVSMAMRPDGGEIWTVDTITSAVSVVTFPGARVIRSIRVGAEPHGIAFSPSGDRAYVACSAVDRVDVIDTSTYSVVNQIDIPARSPRAIVELNGTIYVTSFLSGNGTAPLGDPAWTDSIVEVRHVDEFPGLTALPDRDLFAIPITGSPATDALDSSATVSGLGTILFNMEVRPGTDELWIPHTDALNGVTRGERNFVEGQVVRNRIAVVRPGAATTYIDLDALIADPRLRCAEPTGVAFKRDGTRAFVFGYGSDSVAVLDVAGSSVSWAGTIRIRPQGVYPEGSGPRAGAVSPDGRFLMVHNKSENSLSRVRLADLPATAGFEFLANPAISMGMTPEPTVIRRGRHLFVKTQNSKSMTSSCNSCHVDAHIDGLAWNLGAFLDPEGTPSSALSFPVDDKGPLVTQTLRRLMEVGPYHWRGEKKSLRDFNAAFVGLLEREVDGVPQDLGGDFLYITQYMEHVAWRPNHRQQLDRTLTPMQQAGASVFLNRQTHQGLTCAQCHPLPLGTRGEIVDHKLGSPARTTVVPSLRGVADKLSPAFAIGGDFAVRTELGAGLGHGGAVPSIEAFLTQQLAPPLSGPRFTLSPGDVSVLTAFLESFDTGLAPATGFQATAHAGNALAVQANELAYLENQAALGHCDLVFRYGPLPGLGKPRYTTGLYDPVSASYRLASMTLSDVSSQSLIDLALAGTPVTFVGVPPWMGYPMGIDRDWDQMLDLDEIIRGADPEDHDTDDDGFPDGYEAFYGQSPTVPNPSVPDFDPPQLAEQIKVHYVTTNAAKLEVHTNELVRVTVDIDGHGPFQRFPLDHVIFDDAFSIVVSELTPGTLHTIGLLLRDPAGNETPTSVLVQTQSPVFSPPVHVESISMTVVGSTPDVQIDVQLLAGDARPPLGYQVRGRIYHVSPSGLAVVDSSVTSWVRRTDGLVTIFVPIPPWVVPGTGELFFVVEEVRSQPGRPPYVEADDVQSTATLPY